MQFAHDDYDWRRLWRTTAVSTLFVYFNDAFIYVCLTVVESFYRSIIKIYYMRVVTLMRRRCWRRCPGAGAGAACHRRACAGRRPPRRRADAAPPARAASPRAPPAHTARHDRAPPQRARCSSRYYTIHTYMASTLSHVSTDTWNAMFISSLEAYVTSAITSSLTR